MDWCQNGMSMIVSFIYGLNFNVFCRSKYIGSIMFDVIDKYTVWMTVDISSLFPHSSGEMSKIIEKSYKTICTYIMENMHQQINK